MYVGTLLQISYRMEKISLVHSSSYGIDLYMHDSYNLSIYPQHCPLLLSTLTEDNISRISTNQ